MRAKEHEEIFGVMKCSKNSLGLWVYNCVYTYETKFICT